MWAKIHAESGLYNEKNIKTLKTSTDLQTFDIIIVVSYSWLTTLMSFLDHRDDKEEKTDLRNDCKGRQAVTEKHEMDNKPKSIYMVKEEKTHF